MKRLISSKASRKHKAFRPDIENLEQFSRRSCLVLHCVNESNDENTDEIQKKTFSEELGDKSRKIIQTEVINRENQKEKTIKLDQYASNVAKCCLLHMTLSYRDTLYFLYLSLCLCLSLYMSYLCDLFCHYYFHFHCVFVLVKGIIG